MEGILGMSTYESVQVGVIDTCYHGWIYLLEYNTYMDENQSQYWGLWKLAHSRVTVTLRTIKHLSGWQNTGSNGDIQIN